MPIYAALHLYAAFVNFMLNGKYGLDASEAKVIDSLIYIISAIASPLIGMAIGWVGFNLMWVASGIALAIVCHAIFAFASRAVSPVILTAFLGLSYSTLASSLWPLVGVVLPQHQRATAYGLVQSIQNLGLALISILTGSIVDNKGYLVLELFFILCTSLALLAAACLILWDGENGHKLNSRSLRWQKKTCTSQERPPVLSISDSDTAPLLS